MGVAFEAASAPLSRTPQETFPRLLARGRIGREDVATLEDVIGRAREFGERHVRPRALELDRRCGVQASDFPWDVARAGLGYGLASTAIPPQAGGPALPSVVKASVVNEELAAACPGVACIFGAHSLGISPLLFAGPVFWEGLLREIVAAERRGESLLMACGATEPLAGSDFQDSTLVRGAQLGTHARKVPGGWRLNGVKHFISNGSVASWVTVFMPTDRARGDETMCCFLVDTSSEGFSVGHIEHKMGQRACPAAELVFDDVFVPDEQLVGRPGDGGPISLLVLVGSRPPVGAIATGIARGAYERLLAWLRGDPRGQALLERQQVQYALATMEEEIHLARQAYMDAATEFDLISVGRIVAEPTVRALGHVPRVLRASRPARALFRSRRAQDTGAEILHKKVGEREAARSMALSSMAKARGGDVAMRVTNLALEVVGLEAGPIRAELEKLWRDAKLTQIYEGTNQMNRLKVFRGLSQGEEMRLLPRLPGAAAGEPAAVGAGGSR
jgi:alkylation response protein AidB-like acyl-CoA dehydrogenase